MWWLLLIFINIVLGDVSIGFPFNEQLPNVARVDEAYTFTMSNSTYKSSNYESINYSASNLPSWLSFDSNSRTFTGTPSKDNVGDFQIDLTGEDSGLSLTQTYTMTVSNDTGLELSSDNVIFVEISQYGQTNGVDGLVVKEGDQIDIRFDSSVFKSKPDSDRPIVAYYGRSADRSSLPNWISFNSDDLSFTGTVPHVISTDAPSFEYGFSFIGSDYYGYAGAEGIFKIVVGGHQLSTNINETIKVNGTFGNFFDLDVPVFSNVFLDNEIISSENISSVEANDLPSYVEFNKGNYSLTGNFPDDSTFDNFTITVKDVFGNSVDLPYLFDAIGSVFTLKSLPEVNATKGEFFQYSLMDSFFTDVNETKVTADFNADWLTYHEDNKTFTGSTPKNFDNLLVDIDASSPFDEESKSFQIKGIDAKTVSSSSSSSSSSATSSSSSSSSSSTESATSSETPVAKPHNKNKDLRKKLAIGLGVGIPVLLLLIAGILLCCCLKRRKSDEGEKSGDTTLDEEDIVGGGVLAGPKNLANNNVSKIENDVQSTSSSITHVESDSSNYYDADEVNGAAGLAGVDDKPMKSWRANDHSDIAKTSGNLSKSGNFRKSDASLSTVNTEQLFSVRLVEDDSIRNSNQSSFASGQFISNNSLNALLRDDSGNFQRLDSDGNIVSQSNSMNSIRKPLSRSPSANLENIVEHSNENSRDYSDYHSTRLPQSKSESSNILSLSSKKSKQSLYDDFKATQTGDGNFEWVDSNDEDTYKFLNNGKTLNMSLSENSIGTYNTIERPENPSRISNSSLGKKAKLVDFTRRSSLRESAQNLNYTYEGEQVQIHNDDVDSL